MYQEGGAHENGWTLLIGLLLALLACFLLLLCVTVAGVGYLLQREAQRPTPQVVYVTATPTPTPPFPSPTPPPTPPVPSPTPRQQRTPLPTPTPTPLPTTVEQGRVTVLEAERVPIPTRDLRVLGMRFKPELKGLPAVVNPTPPAYQVGDKREFWVNNTDREEHFRITAVLRYVTPHAYFWIEEGVSYNERALASAARFFEEQIYPTNRRVFGEEWEPGVDNDPRITFLHARDLGSTVAGYFSSADSFPQEVSPYSNEMDMFYINLDATRPGDPFYRQVIAHEFQHMIHWYQDRNEDTWLNEGFSVLAEILNGFTLGLHVNFYLDEPDLQLTAWSDEEPTPYYGAAGLFAYYLYERFGEEGIQRIARHPENGLKGVEAGLREAGYDVTAVDVFGDWVVANWVNDPTLAGGRFGYREQVTDRAAATEVIDELPALLSTSVAQFGVDYIRLDISQPVDIYFQGDAATRVAAVAPYSGSYVMWSNRADDSDTRLYTEVDLTNAKEARLTFWTWYDIEELWDFAYIIVSTDGGQTWQMLETPSMTRENPYGNNLGVGYSGVSGGGPAPRWVQESVDLTPFVGQKILVGFEYVTDDAFTRPGFFVDEVCVETDVPEVTFCDGFETSNTRWVQEGFIRTDTFVPQAYLVQVVHVTDEDVLVDRRVVVGGTEARFTASPEKGEAVIIVSGIAPLTWEGASYTLTVQPQQP